MTKTNELVEQIIQDLGGFGKFQVFFHSLMQSVKISVAWSTVTMIFGSAVPDWWCTNNDINFTTVPLFSNVSGFECCITRNGTTCTSFDFEQSMNTIVSEFDLVCGKSWVPSFITTLQMLGLLIGGFASGQVADFIGRKPTFYISILLNSVFNFVAIFSVSWQMYAAMRVGIGIACGFYFTVYFNLMAEFVTGKWRPFICCLPTYAAWAAAFGLMAWLVHDWRYIHVVIVVVSAPFLLTWFIMPESFRWLVSHKRFEDAEAVIARMAKINGKPYSKVERIVSLIKSEELKALQRKDQKEKTKQYTIIDLFRSWKLTKVTICLGTIWLSQGYTYYAINFGVQNLSGDLYMNTALVGLVEAPATILVIFINKWCLGRRRTCALLFLLAVLASIAAGIVQVLNTPNMDSLTNGLSMTIKFASTAAWGCSMILTTESYPTVVRNIGYGLNHMMSRVGSAVSPQAAYWNEKTPGIMYFLCAGATLLSFLATFFIPETKNRAICDVLMERVIEDPEVIQENGENGAIKLRSKVDNTEENTLL